MFNYSSKYVYDLNMVGKKKRPKWNKTKQNKKQVLVTLYDTVLSCMFKKNISIVILDFF